MVLLDAVVILLWILLAYTVYLNVLALIVIRYDKSLTHFQKTVQTFIVLLVPIIGAAYVLHLLFKASPKTIPRSWIPWPFKTLIYGPPIKRYDDAPPRRSGGGRYGN